MSWSEPYPLAKDSAAFEYFTKYPEMQCKDDEYILNWEDYKAALEDINVDVNMNNTWVSEEKDSWDHNLPGDCENFALLKRRLLNKYDVSLDDGVPLGAMHICVGTVPRLGFHAVLLVSTNRGDKCLDNMSPDIYTLGTTNFKPLWRTSIGLTKKVWI